MAYSIEPRKNTLTPGQSGVLEFQIEGTEEDILKIHSCNVFDLGELAKDPDKVEGSTTGTEDDDIIPAENGHLKYLNLKPKGTGIIFSLSGVLPKPELAGTEEGILLKVEIYDKRGNQLGTTLPFKTHISAKAPTVDYFRLYPSIIRSNGELKLSWKYSNADYYEIKRRDGTLVRKGSINPDEEITDYINTRAYLDNDNYDEFSLRITYKEMVSTEINIKRKVSILKTSEWQRKILVEKVDDSLVESEMVNLVLNDDKTKENKIWALARSKEKADNGKVFLWNSYDGLEWHSCKNKEKQKLEIPAGFIDSPALFLHNTLYLVGGSKVDISQASNKIERYTLEYDNQGVLTWHSKAIPDAPWPARMGHSCVVFDNKIWVIGGADKNGNGLNDVWYYDGVIWTEVKPAGEAFPKRCLFGAAVRTDNGKEELWIGGGQQGYRGNPVNDIWKYDGKVWEQVQTVKNNELSPLLLGTGIRAATLTNLKDKICAIVIGENHKYHTLKKQDKTEVTQPFSFEDSSLGNTGNWSTGRNKYALITRSFNGCIWLIAKERKLEGVVTSSLYYSAPNQV